MNISFGNNKFFLKYLIQFILCVACVYFPGIEAKTATTKPIFCSQQYALCTSAPCIPDPKNSGYAICSCVVENGISAGYSTCEKRIPKQDHFKTIHLVSTFSLEQFTTKKSLTCPKGSPWTDCLDFPCTVDPMNPAKAICNCKIHHEEEFFTFGGDCNMKTCSTGFWSGATIKKGLWLRNAVIQKLNLKNNSLTNNACTK